MNILITGANGGIGFAIVKYLISHFPTAQLHGTYNKEKPNLLLKNLTWYHVDMTDNEQVHELSKQISSLDWIINCVGFLHSKEKGPEKNVTLIDPDFFFKNVALNTLPSMLLAKHFLPTLQKSSAAKFAVISAKIGSIGDNNLGGWYSYRISKAGLNMFIKTLALEWKRLIKQGVVLSLHPGTTDTALSKPFQRNLKQGQLFTPDEVAFKLISIIETSTPDDSGKFYAYDKKELPW